MATVVSIVLRAVIAGVLVTAFAMLGDKLSPKKFAGIFSGAPSVALANLVVLAAMKGTSDVADSLVGMILGAVAFIIAACVGVVGYQRLKSMANSVLIWVTWGAVALASSLVLR
ncbi:MAG: hypothetical protein QOK28_3776 [Actinomycetota bacterium]|jgi:hypothetical protein